MLMLLLIVLILLNDANNLPLQDECSVVGSMKPHETQCKLFYLCNTGKQWEARSCPQGLHFNSYRNVCDWPANVNCENESLVNNQNDIINGPPIIHIKCPIPDAPYDVLLPHPNCTMFYKCFNGEAHPIDCPDGLHWSATHKWCDYPENARCVNDGVPPQPTPSITTTSENPLSSSSSSPTTWGSTIAHTFCPLIDHYVVHLPHPDCGKFYKCAHSIPREITCPPGLHWNPNGNWCDFPFIANCKDNEAPPQEHFLSIE